MRTNSHVSQMGFSTKNRVSRSTLLIGSVYSLNIKYIFIFLHVIKSPSFVIYFANIALELAGINIEN
jgi:hypothetical protein